MKGVVVNTRRKKAAAAKRGLRKKRMALALYLGLVFCLLSALVYFSRRENAEKIQTASLRQESPAAAGMSDAGTGIRTGSPGEAAPALAADSFTREQAGEPDGSKSGGINRDLPADQAAALNVGTDRLRENKDPAASGSGNAGQTQERDPAGDGAISEAEADGQGEPFFDEDSPRESETARAAQYEYTAPVSDDQIREEPSAADSADREEPEYSDGPDQQEPAPDQSHFSTIEDLLADIKLPEIDIPFLRPRRGTEDSRDSTGNADAVQDQSAPEEAAPSFAGDFPDQAQYVPGEETDPYAGGGLPDQSQYVPEEEGDAWYQEGQPGDSQEPDGEKPDLNDPFDPSPDADAPYDNGGNGTDPAEGSSEGDRSGDDDGTLPAAEEDSDPSAPNESPYESPYESGDIFLPEVP